MRRGLGAAPEDAASSLASVGVVEAGVSGSGSWPPLAGILASVHPGRMPPTAVEETSDPAVLSRVHSRLPRPTGLHPHRLDPARHSGPLPLSGCRARAPAVARVDAAQATG